MTFKTFIGKFWGEIPVTENEAIALGLASAIILVGIALA